MLFGVPLAADRLAPLVPEALERRLGDVAEKQVKLLFDGKVCNNAAGQQAFAKLVNALREPAGLDPSVQSAVLSSSIPNAFALPGGKVFLFDGLLAKAENPDEIAGVLAHELGHLKHRDNMRGLIYNGGTSFLIGLLVRRYHRLERADLRVAHAGHLVAFARGGDATPTRFAIDVMQQLGRSPKPMGELLFRVTGKEGGKGLSILSGHPLTEDRLARMSREDTPPSGPPLLTPEEWVALKSICQSGSKV